MLSLILTKVFIVGRWAQRETLVAWEVAKQRFVYPGVPDGLCEWGDAYDDHNHEDDCNNGEQLMLLDPDDDEDDD